MGGTSIGEASIIFPSVTLYPQTKIGRHCRLHSGVVIGADGFGLELIDGVHEKIWHIGNVEIGDHVEIGANSCVDAATFSSTTIGDGTKIDNLVQVGHNAQIGKHVLLCGQSGVGGSGVAGDYATIGGQAGVGPHASIGTQAQLGGGGMVPLYVPDRASYAGHPARPYREWLKGKALLKRMAEEK